MSSAQQQQAPPSTELKSQPVEAAVEPAAKLDLSLEEMSRIMDVAVALRRERNVAETELNRDETLRVLREKLREAAAVSGGTLTDAEIDAAIRQYYDRLHAYQEPPSSWETFLAHVYIRRTQIAVAITAIGGAILAWSFLSLVLWLRPGSGEIAGSW